MNILKAKYLKLKSKPLYDIDTLMYNINVFFNDYNYVKNCLNEDNNNSYLLEDYVDFILINKKIKSCNVILESMFHIVLMTNYDMTNKPFKKFPLTNEGLNILKFVYSESITNDVYISIKNIINNNIFKEYISRSNNEYIQYDSEVKIFLIDFKPILIDYLKKCLNIDEKIISDIIKDSSLNNKYNKF